MSSKIEKIVYFVKHPKLFKRLVSMGFDGYFKDIGWIDSYIRRIPIDKDGNPLPWVTYSFIDFISDRLNRRMKVFEFGSGNSTLWYAAYVDHVYSVEHDYKWYKNLKGELPENVSLFHCDLEYDGAYSKFIKRFDQRFDIVIVDGRDRLNCIRNAVDTLKEDGVIVLDDSERECYGSGVDRLAETGFKRLDFWGISPGLFYKKCTTVFYKEKNCLGI